MELRQLRYFVAVAEELNFRRAAARLHMSQPPLSNQVRKLETQLGYQLLQRSRRHVALTPAGESLLRDAKALFRQLDDAVTMGRRIDAGHAGVLRVNFVGSALLSIVPVMLRRFRAAWPDVQVLLGEGTTEEQVRKVAEGEIDLGLVPLPVDTRRVMAEPLIRELTVAALPTTHPLACMERVPLSRLSREPLVLFPRAQAPGLHDRLVARLSAGGAPPTVIQEAPETHTIVALVAAGIGISLVQRSVQRLALPGVTYRPVIGAPVVELAAIYHPDRPKPLSQAFLDLGRGHDPEALTAADGPEGVA